MEIKLKLANKDHKVLGWVLDCNQVIDIQERLKGSGFNFSLEEIEMILLASAGKEHLINI